jgi:hypothetical protein
MRCTKNYRWLRIPTRLGSDSELQNPLSADH